MGFFKKAKNAAVDLVKDGVEINPDKVGEKLKEAYDSLTHLNVMVCGKTGVGKSTLINAVFTEEKAQTGVGLPVTDNIDEYSKEGVPLSIFDCPGFELDNKQRADIMKQIKYTVKEKNIQCIWYCINVMGSKIEKVEAESIRQLKQLTVHNEKDGYRNMPVVIVLTQAYVKDRVNGLKKAIQEDCGLKNIPIVDVVAKEEDFDGKKIKPRNLDKLIDHSSEGMIREAKSTLIAMQMVNLKQKQKKSVNIIAVTALTSFAVGTAPIPFADAPALVAAEVAMIAKITVNYGLDVDKGTITALIASALGTGGATILGREFLSWLLKATGVGAVVGSLFAGSTALILTVILGEAYMKLMDLVFIGELSKSQLSSKKGQKIFADLFKKAMKNKDKSKLLKILSSKVNINNK